MPADICTEGIRLTGRGVSRQYLTRLAARIGGLAGAGDAHVTIVVTGDAYMRNLNRDYRKKDRTTDVISFAAREAPFPGERGGIEDLGEIYLCLNQAERQAEEYGVTLREEVARLLIHGYLHLVGYDHERSKRAATIMERKEASIMEALAAEITAR